MFIFYSILWVIGALVTTILYNRYIEDKSYYGEMSAGHNFVSNLFIWPVLLGQFFGEYSKLKRQKALEDQKREDKRIALEMKLAEAEFKRLGL